MIKNSLLIYSFYRFTKINNKNNIKKNLDKYFKNKLIRGTILVANEGINASISGTEEDLLNTVKLIKKILKIRKLDLKINEINFLPFNRIKVRLKNEIVSLGKKGIEINKYTGKFIHPSEWNEIVKRKDIRLIDTRNNYETDIGQFKNAINPNTNSFRELPGKLEKMGIKKNDKLAMYCTGGIRCEKASAYLKLNGFKNVNQLDGGILNYLHYMKKNKKDSLWKGECFVFDNRVTVNSNLKKGKYIQCHGCRQPLTKKELKSKFYRKGVSCQYCFSSRNNKQKSSSMTRQEQINRAEINKEEHSFKKITLSDYD